MSQLPFARSLALSPLREPTSGQPPFGSLLSSWQPRFEPEEGAILAPYPHLLGLHLDFEAASTMVLEG